LTHLLDSGLNLSLPCGFELLFKLSLLCEQVFIW
jgi:hypothetical protein